jgi:hypothetical protein
MLVQLVPRRDLPRHGQRGRPLQRDAQHEGLVGFQEVLGRRRGGMRHAGQQQRQESGEGQAQ